MTPARHNYAELARQLRKGHVERFPLGAGLIAALYWETIMEPISDVNGWSVHRPRHVYVVEPFVPGENLSAHKQVFDSIEDALRFVADKVAGAALKLN